MIELGVSSTDFAPPGAEAHFPPDVELEPVHLDIALRVDLEKRCAGGVVTHNIRSVRNGPRAIDLHGVDLEQVDVRSDDEHEIEWSYDGRQIRVVWQVPFAADEERTLAVHYKAVKPVAGLHFSHRNEDDENDCVWAATDHETELARHWLPTVDLPNVRPNLSFHLTAKSSYTILANGQRIGEEEHEDGTKTSHWELQQRCPSYLVCFAIGEFTCCEDGEHDGKPIAYFSTREFESDDLARTFGRTGAMLEWMTQKLDSPFPFPKYFQIAVPEIGGAMENISLVSWDDKFVLDETLALEWGWLVDQINLHEMAHSWFGDHIVCRDFAHAWLKESWAVYMETCWLEDTKGADERDYDFFQNLDAYIKEADEKYVRPIATREFDHSWSMYDRHLYPGGAARLHMLRKEIGDESFWAGVRDYVRRFGGEVVETDDFRKVMEQHSGKSLVKWFEQWIESKGYPQLKVSFHYDATKHEGIFEVEQKQVDDAKGVSLFDFPTDLAWESGGQIQCREVRIHRDKHTFVFNMPDEPNQVRVDPLARTVCKIEFNPGDDKLRKQLSCAKDVYGRILAARELCKTSRRRNIEVVREAYLKEAFWGCRQRFAEALGEANCEAAVEALAELLTVEQDPMVCEHLVRAAGKYRDPRILASLVRFLDDGPPFYRARGAAWEMLGEQRERAPFDRILAALNEKSPLGWEQQGVFRALAATGKREALQPLLDASEPGATHERARHAVIEALGNFARRAERTDHHRVIERLADLLRDPVRRIRETAVKALKQAGGVDAINEIEAYSRGLSEQDQAEVRQVLRAMRDSATDVPDRVDRQLDGFRETVRKLIERIDLLEARVATDD